MSQDNILYFPNLVDLRIAPKCGWQSTMQFHYIMLGNSRFKDHPGGLKYTHVKGGPQNWRDYEWWTHGDIMDIPFRKNSIRFVIKRDPVKRFLSAIDYLQTQKIVKLTNRDYPATGFSSLDRAVSAMERGVLMNVHLLPQTYFYGNDPNKYDHIYDINNINDALLHIKEICNYNMKRMKKYPVADLHKNKSIKSLSLELTDDLEEKIKKVYKIDYDNGWC